MTNSSEEARETSLGYQRAKQLAAHSDPSVRATLASRSDLRPELLYYLAADPDPSVRRTIAINRTTPGQADLLLARDRDPDVRSELAAKIAHLVPELTAEEREQAERTASEVLDILARDQIRRVRQIIAETLQSVANAPVEIVRHLARDPELNVAAPLLEFSPLLTDGDLLGIIRTSSARGSLVAISRRNGLGEKVADAVAASKDVAAIAALLGNNSAQIREETLDRLIDRAPMVESWHDPLCRRPSLPPGAIARLSRFVADHLLDVLKARSDVDAEALDAISKEVHRRLEEAATDGKARNEKDEYGEAQRLFKAAKLTPEVAADAIRAGRRTFAIDALALLADVSRATIEKALSTKSAKGVVALCWKAKLPACTAEEVQRRLAGIRPNTILHATRDGQYPMEPADMTWQLEFLADLAGTGGKR